MSEVRDKETSDVGLTGDKCFRFVDHRSKHTPDLRKQVSQLGKIITPQVLVIVRHYKPMLSLMRFRIRIDQLGNK